ncbi:hypothetical protein V1525DRAFT_54341 [Lipomyces kononenkoae]|uniref:Uncharacterized protein n=1 Tax=Lipomyces kononenkoae TaxID=34357 RepID=A0ACC3SS60_LIPKO
MYMEALFVQKNLWEVVSGTGLHDVSNLEDALVLIKKNNYAYLDMVLTLGDHEHGLLETKDVEHIWRGMKQRCKESSLVRQLALVNKLFTWKCKRAENPDKWVQGWCDVLERIFGHASKSTRLLESSYVEQFSGRVRWSHHQTRLQQR